MQCNSCGGDLTSVLNSRSVELEWDGEHWIEKNVFSSNCGCPHCYEDISAEDADEMGIPIEYR